MGKKVKVDSNEELHEIRPALTPDARENQMIGLAVDLVEKRLRNGTASAQETVHFLKLGSSKNRLETERLRLENNLIKAKTKVMESMENSESLVSEALQAFKSYAGNGNSDDSNIF